MATAQVGWESKINKKSRYDRQNQPNSASTVVNRLTRADFQHTQLTNMSFMKETKYILFKLKTLTVTPCKSVGGSKVTRN